jgi:UDP:flavonoid glycosyltransferase YjiC (YdhE family)
MQKTKGPSLHFVREHLDLQMVSESCSVAISNGNHGTVCQFLMAGIPQLVAPLHMEQELLARRLQEMGAALMLDARSGKGAASGAQILTRDGSYREAAQAFSQRYRERDAKTMARVALRRVLLGVNESQ